MGLRFQNMVQRKRVKPVCQPCGMGFGLYRYRPFDGAVSDVLEPGNRGG